MDRSALRSQPAGERALPATARFFLGPGLLRRYGKSLCSVLCQLRFSCPRLCDDETSSVRRPSTYFRTFPLAVRGCCHRGSCAAKSCVSWGFDGARVCTGPIERGLEKGGQRESSGTGEGERETRFEVTPCPTQFVPVGMHMCGVWVCTPSLLFVSPAWADFGFWRPASPRRGGPPPRLNHHPLRVAAVFVGCRCRKHPSLKTSITPSVYPKTTPIY